MLKGNKKWKALDWQLRVMISCTVLAVIVWWPLVSTLSSAFDIHAYQVGIFGTLVFLFGPWMAGGLYIGYKEWFTDEAA